MPKYSTGGGGGGNDGDSCELCGDSSTKLRRANVAGADLMVCPDCAPHDDSRHGGGGGSSGGSSSSSDGEPNRKKRAAQRQAKMYDRAKGDSKHWEEGTNYEKDRLPYLVSDYGDVVANARQEAGLTVEELAADLDAEESDVDAVEQGQATRADVGGSLIRALEERLGVTLADE